jgi:hypothetical protein
MPILEKNPNPDQVHCKKKKFFWCEFENFQRIFPVFIGGKNVLFENGNTLLKRGKKKQAKIKFSFTRSVLILL